MTKIALPLTLPAAVLACALSAAAAQAQSRTYTVVSAAAGLNGLPSQGACGSMQSPCRTLQGAFNVTAANGVIDVISPGEYGPLSITGPISIQGHGWASVTAASGNAITINAGASDKITIRGVLLDGIGTGTYGIAFITGASLNLQDSAIRDFAGNGAGIFFQPGASGLLFVSNTVISDNKNGIIILPTGPGTVQSVLDHVKMEYNSNDGLSVSAGGNQIANVTVADSVSASNSQYGIYASSEGGNISLMIRNTIIHSNGNVGLYNSGATIYVTRSTITANTTGWGTAAPNGFSPGVSSYADNNIDGNSAGNTAPPSTPYK